MIIENGMIFFEYLSSIHSSSGEDSSITANIVESIDISDLSRIEKWVDSQ